jgi:pyrimidine-specific ribonucleoside hydrolase
MVMRIFWMVICILTGILFPVAGQPLPSVRNVIIDTDGAPDDLRAICMMAAVSDFHILGITTSDGALSPEMGRQKSLQLLYVLRMDSIPVGCGRSLGNYPAWRKTCEKIPWGDKTRMDVDMHLDAVSLMKEVLTASERPVTLVCLGALTNLYDLLTTWPQGAIKIAKVIWYNEALVFQPGTNFSLDRQASEYILSHDLPVDVISNLSREGAEFSTPLLSEIEKIPTRYAQAVTKAHKSPSAKKKMKNKELQLWDDLIPVYLLYPVLFDMQPETDHPSVAINTGYQLEGVKERILQLLAGVTIHEKNILFDVFPIEANLYQYDIRGSLPEILARWGREEWRACVLTSEIHGHLGIYSVIGAKMGLKARELLGAGIDQLTVVSFAGSQPPLSCMNDGLQTSTGATLGMGTISLQEASAPSPKAIFTYKNKSIELKLKDIYKQQIDNDINQGILQYGNLTAGYWKLIRALGLKYWLQWDRNDLFELTNRDAPSQAMGK